MLKNLLKKYGPEFILIFISVVLGFFFTEWSSSRSEKVSEKKILAEILNGLKADKEDFNANINNYNISLRGLDLFRKWAEGHASYKDSAATHYLVLMRNFAPVINKTAFESFKSSGLKSIESDSLRSKIISLYDFHYSIISKLEEQMVEMQDFNNFYKAINDLLLPYMLFDAKGKLLGFKKANLNQNQKNELLSYLWRMEIYKKFRISRYQRLLTSQETCISAIEKELKL
jgi:hypothetical protein